MKISLGILLESITVLVEVFIVCLYLKSLFEPKTRRAHRAIGYSVFFLLFTIISVSFPHPIILITFTFSAVLGLSLLFYEGSVSRMVCAAILFCGLMTVSEIICGGVFAFLSQIDFGMTKHFGDKRLVGIVISKFVQMLMVKIMGFWVQRKHTTAHISIKQTLPLYFGQIFLMGLTYYLFMVGYLNSQALSPITLCLTTGILFIDVLLFWYFDSIAAILEYKQLKAAEEIQLEQQKKYYALLEQRQREMDSYWHDVGKHLSVIRQLRAETDSEVVEDYISELEASYRKTPRIARTPNLTINSVLNYNLEQCKALDIDVVMDIRLLQNIMINPTDICIILGNIFENAIEACATLHNQKRVINITICYASNSLLVEMSNPYDQSPKKPTERVRGIGLQNVANILKKYNGHISYHITDNEYSVAIVIPNIPCTAK